MTDEQLLQAWEADPEDYFEFEIKRAPEDREPGRAVSAKAVDALLGKMGAFILARLKYRMDRGLPADRFNVRIEVSDPED